MNARLLGTLLVAFACSARVSRGQDHLEPERGSLHEIPIVLERNLTRHRTLLADAPQYYRARMICVPSFQPDWVVTLARDEAEGRGFFIEYTVLAAPLFDQKPEEIRVTRVRAPIDRKAAEAVQAVWLRMLREVRPPDELRLGADGAGYHFSRFVPIGSDDPLAPPGLESGFVWSPWEDTTTARLARVACALRDYATAPADERGERRAEIIRGVDAVRARLGDAIPPPPKSHRLPARNRWPDRDRARLFHRRPAGAPSFPGFPGFGGGFQDGGFEAPLPARPQQGERRD